MFTLYGEDTHFTTTVAELTRSGLTGALKEQRVRGRTDVAVLLTNAAGATIAAATLPLTEATSGGVYFGTWQGSTLTAALAAIPTGGTIGRRVQIGTDLSPIEWGQWFPTPAA
jgi:hypothetical protein